MQVTVHVPASLRQYSNGARQVRLEVEQPTTVAELFARLHAHHPGVVERALDECGLVRQHVNVFVDGESIRAGSALGLQTPVRASTEVWILPAVSGG
jgi:molybdopterin converting factor small subunit